MNNFHKYLPAILTSIMTVQSIAPLLKGKEKQTLALALLQAGSGVASTIPNEHVQQISSAIPAIVVALQSAGILTKDQVPNG